MIEQFMPESVPHESILSFRKDLTFIAPEEGKTSTFKLKSPYIEHNFNGMPFMARLGELVSIGQHSAGDVVNQLVLSGQSIRSVNEALQHLYVKGLLNDDPAYNGIATRRQAA